MTCIFWWCLRCVPVGKPKDDESKTRLAELEKQLKHIIDLKEKYVKDHPDEKDQVFKTRGPRRPRGDGEDVAGQQQGGESSTMAMGGGGRPGRDPKRSIYYDPVYNPFGAPPPGMPYREKSTFSSAGVRVRTRQELS